MTVETETPATALTVRGRGQPIEAVDVPDRTCAVQDCPYPLHAHTYCARHAARFRRHGDPLGSVRRPTAEERFWAKVDVRRKWDCWLWQARVLPNGYGQFNPTSRVPVYAHRYAWELEQRQPIPAGLHIDHICGVRACVNPLHLDAVTQAENNRRALAVRAALEERKEA